MSGWYSSGGSTVVEHSPRRSKVKGSSPVVAAATGKEEMVKKVLSQTLE